MKNRSNHHSIDYFYQLPLDVLLQIFSYLNADDLTNLAQVNKNLYQRSTGYQFSLNSKMPLSFEQANNLWKNKYIQHFSYSYSPLLEKAENVNWYQSFIKNYADKYKNFPPEKCHLLTIFKEGDIAALKKIKLTLQNLKMKDKGGRSVLQWAIKNNNQKMLDYIYEHIILPKYKEKKSFFSSLIKKNTDEQQNENYRQTTKGNNKTLLYWAVCTNQSFDIIQTIINQHGMLLHKTNESMTLLHLVAKMNLLELAKKMLETQKIEINKIYNNKGTALYMAAKYGHLDMVKLLLSHKANKNSAYYANYCPLTVATQRDDIEMVKMLLSASGKNAEEYLDAALWIAIMRKKTEIAEILLKHGANINSTVDNQTLLYLAAALGDKELVQWLLQHKSRLNIGCGYYSYEIDDDEFVTRHDNKTALWRAIDNNHQEIAEILLDAGANVNIANHNNVTPLFLAIDRGNDQLVKKLLKKGADVEIAEATNGKTPLIAAIYKDNKEMVELLLNHGAKPTHAAYEVAQKQGKKTIMQALLKRSQSDLHMAAQEEKIEQMKTIFINNSSAIYNKDCAGKIPLAVATPKTKAILMLMDYKNKIEKQKDHRYSFRLFNTNFLNDTKTFFGHEFNISKPVKLLAWQALWDVYVEGKKDASLEMHHAALSNGRLENIYKNLTNAFSEKSVSSMTQIKANRQMKR